jgi:signal transduction histidine kinase/FixJ family two-component response regulator
VQRAGMNNKPDITKVIVVDDEEHIRSNCSRALEKIGINTDTAESAEKCLDMVKSGEYKVALLDIGLPGMDGIELLGVLKENYPQLEVIMMTGDATIENAVDAMKSGAYDFITKPFEIHEIRKAVRKALEKGELSREVKELREIVSINNVAKAISRLMPLEELVELIFVEAKECIDADEGSVALFDKASNEITIEYALGRHRDEAAGAILKTGERICGYVAVHREPILINGPLHSDPRFRELPVYNGVKSGMCVPMIVKNEIIGMLNFRRITNEEPFTENDLKIAGIFAQQAALAIQNSRDWEKLKELDELKTEFIANVSHELRTPLQTITNSCEILMHEEHSSDRIVSVLMRNAERMKRLISQLLDFSRMEKSGFKLELKPHDFTGIIRECVEEISTLASKRNIGISNKAGTHPPLYIDRDAIKRVLLNILDNSIKYCPEGSSIEIRTAQTNRNVKVEVEDNGPGIPENAQKHIFERFYQKEPGKSFTEKPQGLGLGLTMVRQIVEKHGGKIWIDSAPGKGSKFTFTLPA